MLSASYFLTLPRQHRFPPHSQAESLTFPRRESVQYTLSPDSSRQNRLLSDFLSHELSGLFSILAEMNVSGMQELASQPHRQ